MSSELADAVRVALDDGCSLADLEVTLLARRDTEDQIAAAWLYAWAYDAIRPPRDELAARVTTCTAGDQTLEQRMILNAAIDRSRTRGTPRSHSGDRRDFHGGSSSSPRSSRCPARALITLPTRPLQESQAAEASAGASPSDHGQIPQVANRTDRGEVVRWATTWWLGVVVVGRLARCGGWRRVIA